LTISSKTDLAKAKTIRHDLGGILLSEQDPYTIESPNPPMMPGGRR
jgi:hypothetical protein